MDVLKARTADDRDSASEMYLTTLGLRASALLAGCKLAAAALPVSEPSSARSLSTRRGRGAVATRTGCCCCCSIASSLKRRRACCASSPASPMLLVDCRSATVELARRAKAPPLARGGLLGPGAGGMSWSMARWTRRQGTALPCWGRPTARPPWPDRRERAALASLAAVAELISAAGGGGAGGGAAGGKAGGAGGVHAVASPRLTRRSPKGALTVLEVRELMALATHSAEWPCRIRCATALECWKPA